MTSNDRHIRVLGPVEIVYGSGPVALPSGQVRVLLAALVAAMGQPVPVEVLAGRLWPDRAPQYTRATVHTYIARLRRVLGASAITTAPSGYVLSLPTPMVDLWQFHHLLADAASVDTPGHEVAALRAALALWRGRPFTGVEASWLDSEIVPRLEDEWSAATERLVDLAMREGSVQSFIPRLRDLLHSSPTRESSWLRLVDALRRVGRRAEALAAYRQARDLLRDELGIEPGAALQQLHLEILRDGTDQPDPQPVTERAPTRQLPHDIAHFSDRSELGRLHDLVARIQDDPRNVTRLIALDGAPGTGKSTLAVHFAHQIAAQYPDQQLYLNLRGHGPSEPESPATAAAKLLRAIGVHNEMIPTELDERSAMLRSVLAGQRVLLLLDNVRDAEQVRPLLPGAESLVIVTSRTQLPGLAVREGAHRITLGPLVHVEALALLSATYGQERMAAEYPAASRLVKLCAGLPLALAIVAERAQRADGLTEVLHALTDERMRLDIFRDRAGDPFNDLWTTLSWSYNSLSSDAATMFRRLGLHPADDISPAIAAALIDLPLPRAVRALDELAAGHLVQQRRSGRFEVHDLVRWYAVEKATETDSAGERAEAIRRMLNRYLADAVNADGNLQPHRRRDYVAGYLPPTMPPAVPDIAAGLAWFDSEYDALRSVILWACGNGWIEHAWRLLTSMTTFVERRVPWRDAVDLHERVLAATDAPAGAGYLLNTLSCLHYFHGDEETATAFLHASLGRFQEAADERSEAMVLGNLGLMHGERGEARSARRFAERALELCDRFGYRRGRALNLDNLGVARNAVGDHEGAIQCHTEAHTINRELGDLNSEATNWHHLGRAYHALHRHGSALQAFREASEIYCRLGNLRLTALTRVDMGRSLLLGGRPDTARAIWTDALETLTMLGDNRAPDLEKAILELCDDQAPLTTGV